MPLQSTGPISMSNINTELSKVSTSLISLNDTDVRALLQKLGSGTMISISDAYGKSSVFCNISASVTTINEGEAVTFTFTNGPASGTYSVNLTSTSTIPIFDFTVQDGIFYNNVTNQLGTITFNAGTASFIVYTIPDATVESTETSYQLEIRSGSPSGPVVATSGTINVVDQGSTAPTSWVYSTVSSATGTGNLVINNIAGTNRYFAILAEVCLGTSNDTTNDAGWTTLISDTTVAKLSYKTLAFSEAGTSVSNLGSSNDRAMACYFFRPNMAGSSPSTVTVLSTAYSTTTGALELLNTGSAGVVLGSNEMGIVFYNQYVSGTSTSTFGTTPGPFIVFNNAGSAFQKSVVKVYPPGSKIPWRHTINDTSITGATIRRMATVLKLTW
jgi:hypothetical protein